jgi:hypothetical protein
LSWLTVTSALSAVAAAERWRRPRRGRRAAKEVVAGAGVPVEGEKAAREGGGFRDAASISFAAGAGDWRRWWWW